MWRVDAEMKGKPTVRLFAPENWGEVDRFAHFYSGTFNFSGPEKRAVSGVLNHFNKAIILRNLAVKLAPNLEIDLQQLEEKSYTPAENSYELSSVVETVFTELYSSIDCTKNIVFALYKKCRGIPNSTRKMFRNIQIGNVSSDFPEDLKTAFKDATWFDDLRSIRDELTHLDLGTCHLDKEKGLVSYMHHGIRRSEGYLIIEDIFQRIDLFIKGVNRFLGSVFHFLNSLLKKEPVFEMCGIFSGRGYSRYIVPSETIDFNSGVCDSHTWFDLPDNPRCPFADSCGAYASAKNLLPT